MLWWNEFQKMCFKELQLILLGGFCSAAQSYLSVLINLLV